jgi:hypothetical protein
MIVATVRSVEKALGDYYNLATGRPCHDPDA